MGFGFRWRVRLLPGVHLNLSKSGPSLSLGRAPLTLNLGGRQHARVTVSAPGTGLSYRTSLGSRSRSSTTDADPGTAVSEAIEVPPEDPNWQPVTPLEGYRFKHPPPPLETSFEQTSAADGGAADETTGPHVGRRIVLILGILSVAAAGYRWFSPPEKQPDAPRDEPVAKSDPIAVAPPATDFVPSPVRTLPGHELPSSRMPHAPPAFPSPADPPPDLAPRPIDIPIPRPRPSRRPTAKKGVRPHR